MAAAKKRRFNKKVWREGAPVSLVTLLVGMHIYETMMGNRTPFELANGAETPFPDILKENEIVMLKRQ